MKVLAIIPARGGSKGIPNKNIKKLCGKPLIQYSIEAAQSSELITSLFVSTDSFEIESCSRKLGVEVIKRPEELSDDGAPMLPVIQHAVQELEKKKVSFDYTVILQPTCPIRSGKDIDSAILELIRRNADSIVSVYKVDDHHPGRMYELVDGALKPLEPELVSVNRQDLPLVYHRNGSIYITKAEVLRKGSIYGMSTIPYIMDYQRSVNIDNMMDWYLAETMIENGVV